MSAPQLNHRLLDSVRAWMARRREMPPPPLRDESDAWGEVEQASRDAEVAFVRFRRSFADLEAEVLRHGRRCRHE